MPARYEDLSTVFSILPMTLNEDKPGLRPAHYQIQGVKNPREQLSSLVIVRASFAVYIDENRPALIVPEPSDRVAEAICRDYRVSMSHVEPNVAEPGLFWLKDKRDVTTILMKQDREGWDELQRHREMQMTWFKRLVAEADDYWSKVRSRRMISDLQRAAAECLGLAREWNISAEVQEALSKCKFCFAQVHPSAIVCSHCSGVLDMARYKAEFVKAEKSA